MSRSVVIDLTNGVRGKRGICSNYVGHTEDSVWSIDSYHPIFRVRTISSQALGLCYVYINKMLPDPVSTPVVVLLV
jgi:hypothetical protein